MWKETIICIVIIITIIIGNIITQNYTVESIQKLTKELEELKSEITSLQQGNSKDKVNDKINEITAEWESRHDKLAYYIEHDELEKVETNLTGTKSYIETEEYSEAISELDKNIFILEHIEDKYAFNLENVF